MGSVAYDLLGWCLRINRLLFFGDVMDVKFAERMRLLKETVTDYHVAREGDLHNAADVLLVMVQLIIRRMLERGGVREYMMVVKNEDVRGLVC